MKRVHCCDCKRPTLTDPLCEGGVKKRLGVGKLEHGKAYVINQDYACVFYVRKWWKFWASK